MQSPGTHDLGAASAVIFSNGSHPVSVSSVCSVEGPPGTGSGTTDLQFELQEAMKTGLL